MSGFAGIAYLDGKSPSRGLLLQMAQSLSFRGPDGQRIWSDSAAGLMHTAHLVKGDKTRAQGPESLGTGTWITADARLDARDDLVAELRAVGRNADASCSDPQLFLHSYDAWGAECVHHVAGDFAFGIWDGRRRQLFCGCDQFGVRQLYFSRIQSGLVFSNTLECVRLHPGVSDELDDRAISDFLLFGAKCDEDATSFADIRRLPRAHWLKYSAAGIEIREYWRPPTDGEIRYAKTHEYVEHFSELFRSAVADRIRGESAGVLLSGGIDSSSVAATAKQIEKREGFPQVRAFTLASADSEDADRLAAQTVADALGIPLHLLSAERVEPFPHWSAHAIDFPEPVNNPFAVDTLKQSRQIAALTGVVLSGEGADNLMSCEPMHHLRRAWTRGRRKQAAADAFGHLLARFSAPDGLLGPMRRLRSLSNRRTKEQFPNWLSEELTSRLNLRERWIEHDSAIPCRAYPEHPVGYASLFFPQWRAMFEQVDPAYTRVPLEVRYPFLDLRLVEYLLAIPALPWFFRKHLLREAMRGLLPEKVRKRAKIPTEPERTVQATREPVNKVSKPSLCHEMERYVEPQNLGSVPWKGSAESEEMGCRAWSLNFWLQTLRKESTMRAAAVVRENARSLTQGVFFQ